MHVDDSTDSLLSLVVPATARLPAVCGLCFPLYTLPSVQSLWYGGLLAGKECSAVTISHTSDVLKQRAGYIPTQKCRISTEVHGYPLSYIFITRRT